MQTCKRDAIQDIWGPRTGYKHQWPTRVDEHQIEEPEKWVQSACVLCSNGCGMDVGVKDGKMVAVRGRAADRVNKGRLGPKGLYAWQSLQHEDRLKYPLIRRNGKLERASWDEAMSLIVERTRTTQRKLTNHGIAFYTSGQLFLEEFYALAMVGKAGLNTLHMDGNTRLCTATAAASMRESFGSDGQPGSYTDIDFTSCIMLVGHNMSATQTVLWSRILDRLAGPDPPEIIVIDPRKSNCAAKATLHLAPKIGTNCALLNGIQYLLFENGYINEDYVAKHVYGRDNLYDTVKDYPPKYVSEITGVPEEDIRRAGDIIGKSKSLLSTCLQGVYQSNQATASACQVNNINLLLGHIGKPGAGIFQMNGQPTAQNNRETGCDGEYPAFRNYDNKNHMQELADLWNIDYIKLPHWAQPTHAQNLLKYIDGGTIEMLWVSGTNPLVSLPNLPKIRKTFTKDNLFLVVQDIFPNETTAVADVVLPAAAWGEKTGTFTNVDRTVHLSYKAVEPPGEARPDFDIFVDFAKRMDFRGKDGSPLMPWNNPAEAFEAWKRVSKGRPCDYSGLTYEKLSGGSGLQWPCNEKYPFGKERLFDDGIFFTDTEYTQTFGHDLETGAPITKAEYEEMNVAGRAILKPCHYLEEFEPVNEEYPFHLSTGRRTRQFHTRTKTGRTAALQNASPKPCIQISEEDAKELDIKNDEIVLVESRRGKVEIPAKIGNIGKGQTFIPFHYGYFDDDEGRARAANELTQERWDPISKQPMFKSGAIRIIKIADPHGEVKIHAPEPQSAVVKIAETKSKNWEAKSRDKNYNPPQLERMMEYWLAALGSALSTLEEICSETVPKIDHADYEISSGMQIMRRIAASCRDRLQPYTIKYPTDLGYGYDIAALMKDRLFPEERAGDFSGSAAYDALILLQSFYQYLNLCEGHVIALRPTAMAAWDEPFLDAVEFVGSQVERMNKWTRQQLSTRGPQCLLVPCKEAVGMGRRLSLLVENAEQSMRSGSVAMVRNGSVEVQNDRAGGGGGGSSAAQNGHSSSTHNGHSTAQNGHDSNGHNSNGHNGESSTTARNGGQAINWKTEIFS